MRKSQLFRQMLPVLIVLILLVGSCSDKEQPVSPPASFNPEVVSVTPAPNALIGISNDTIMIEFSKPLDASTVNDSTITISPALEADFQYDSVRQTILIIPAEEMEYGRQYTVTVGLGVLDLKGLSLRKEYWWSFRTLSVASLYVVPGGSGDGSSDDPLGSIQQAIDIADSSHIQVIYVASGEYHESVVIEDGVTIYGSRDPSNAWFASEVDSTVLFGQIINGHPVAVLVQDVSATVCLRSVTIIAADATEPGEGSYGVSCVNSSDVNFRDCNIRSGNGAPGIPGEDGVPGHDAPLGEQTHGGMGGLGWHATGYWVCDSVTW